MLRWWLYVFFFPFYSFLSLAEVDRVGWRRLLVALICGSLVVCCCLRAWDCLD